MQRNTYRLASYNLHKCLGVDRRRTPSRTLEVINGIGADIIALQEADRRHAPRPAALPREMIEANSDFTALELDETGVSLGWHGNAILVRAGITAEVVQRLDLPGSKRRGAVVTRIGSLQLVATHLSLTRRSRLKQMAAITKALSAMDPMPTVIIGDFNEWSLKRGMEPFKNDFRVHAPGNSFHAVRPLGALDRIALNRDVHLHDAGVVETPLAKRASDHLPIWADVEIAPTDHDSTGILANGIEYINAVEKI